jgi:hypothetical protein
MTYSELIRAIITADRDGWLRDDKRSVFTLKSDLNITVRECSRNGAELEKCAEEWTTKFPDRNAYVEIFELWYGTSFVNEYDFATVDGFRARLPYPKINDHTITEEQYAVAVAVDVLDTLDDYLKRARIRVVQGIGRENTSPSVQ